MDLRKLKKLIDLVQESGIAELEITEGEEKVKIVKGGEATVTPVAALAPSGAAVPAPVAAPAPAEPAPQQGHVLKAPMVGTFYRSASPESKAYVEVGQNVKAGETVCIIEAMKLMNEIEAEYKCKVVEILKENAQPVEFGSPLFKVERL